MSRFRVHRPNLLAVTAYALVGCASRSVPTHFAETSPASPDAHVPRAARVTDAVSADANGASDVPDVAAAHAHEGHHAHP